MEMECHLAEMKKNSHHGHDVEDQKKKCKKNLDFEESSDDEGHGHCHNPLENLTCNFVTVIDHRSL